MKESDILVQQVVEPFKLHALSSYPNECAGFVTKSLEYAPMTNTSPAPNDTVIVSLQERLRFMEKHGEPLAFLHSHPDGPNCPSKADMQSQITNAIPYGIIVTDGSSVLPPFMWGDQLERMPLLGRPYRYGVHDCYSLARDYFFEKGIDAPNVPRGLEWWKNGESLFVDNIKLAKFQEVDRRDLIADDVLLFTIDSNVPNHLGIYIGEGIMMHHCSSFSRPYWDATKLSKRDPADRWMKYSSHCLRYAG